MSGHWVLPYTSQSPCLASSRSKPLSTAAFLRRDARIGDRGAVTSSAPSLSPAPSPRRASDPPAARPECAPILQQAVGRLKPSPSRASWSGDSSRHARANRDRTSLTRTPVELDPPAAPEPAVIVVVVIPRLARGIPEKQKGLRHQSSCQASRLPARNGRTTTLRRDPSHAGTGARAPAAAVSAHSRAASRISADSAAWRSWRRWLHSALSPPQATTLTGAEGRT